MVSSESFAKTLGQFFLGITIIGMVKLRSLCFKGADLDNTAAVTTCFLPQNCYKQSRSAASDRFTEPLFGMRSTGFGIDFCFLLRFCKAL